MDVVPYIVIFINLRGPGLSFPGVIQCGISSCPKVDEAVDSFRLSICDPMPPRQTKDDVDMVR